MVSDMEYQNTVITDIGTYYIGHFNLVTFRIMGKDWSIHVPFNKIHELMTTVFYDRECEDGMFLDSLKGTYVQVIINKRTNKIAGIAHILHKEKAYYYNNMGDED